MKTPIKRSCMLSLLVLGATGVRADEPGPGGTKVPRPVTGEQIYRNVCQACHMPDARGATGAATIPALGGNPAMESTDYILTMLTRGRGAMPPMTDTLDATQMRAITAYVRTHFGNRYAEPVTAADVTRAIDASHE